MTKTYIILYKDGSMGIFNKRMQRGDFQKDARQFEVPDNLPIIEVCEWQGQLYSHSKFKEVGFE